MLEAPSEAEGLDNWDSVLKLVQRKFAPPDFALPEEDTTIYVSHQAGTPAISSAVQFCSLAQFGDRVRFLVSNEYNPDLTGFVESSSYLLGIKREQAKKLLENHDYAGVEKLVGEYLSDDTKILLAAALQWNYAKFDGFADELAKLTSPDFKGLVQEVGNQRQHWWWEAYEAAYLGIVRLKQGNTVEAMFHSFRAVEGLLKEWLYRESGLQVEDGKAQLLKEVKHINKRGEKKKIHSVNAYGQGLYFALDSVKDIDKNQHIDIWTFGNAVFDRRNDLFHQLGGLQDKEAVFAEWKAPHEQSLDEQGWKDRVKNCLNFVSDQWFGSIEDASLMVKVHQKLKNAIAHI